MQSGGWFLSPPNRLTVTYHLDCVLVRLHAGRGRNHQVHALSVRLLHHLIHECLLLGGDEAGLREKPAGE